MKKIFALLLAVVMMLCVAGCGSTDFKAAVQGDWVLYHYYERTENGEDVFFDDTNFWSVTVGEDAFTITAADDSLENVGGTITWTKADEAEVIMNDGTRCTMRISENDKKHNQSAAFDVYVVETNMYYVLEIPEGEN